MLNAQDLSKALESEIGHRKALDNAWISLQRAISIVDQRIELLQQLIELHSEEADLHAPLAVAIGLGDETGDAGRGFGVRPADATPTSPNDDGEVAGISRTLGKRIYAAVAEYLNRPGEQKARVERLYERLDADLRSEIESAPSTNSALFRFRRLLRRNKDDFHVDRNTGVVTYRRYAPTAESYAGFGPPPEGSFRGSTQLRVFAKRFDESVDNWFLQYRLANGSEHELPVSAFIMHLVEHPSRELAMELAGEAFGLAASTTPDGRRSLHSYLNGQWTPDLDYRLPVTTRKLLPPAPAAPKNEAATKTAPS